MGKIKTLIVEDDPISVMVLQSYLSADTFIIDTAQNGREALQMFCRAFEDHNPYRIIFMDIMMPKQDGVQTLLQIRNFEKHQGVAEDCMANVVITSAVDDRKIIVQTVLLGQISSYLSKPIDINKLKKVMAKITAEIQQTH